MLQCLGQITLKIDIVALSFKLAYISLNPFQSPHLPLGDLKSL